MEFEREPSYHAVLLSRMDDLQAVDVPGLMLEAALLGMPSSSPFCGPIDVDAVLCVLKLVERGAPMRVAAMACAMARWPRGPNAFYARAEPLAALIAAAHWAGRGPELRQHLEAAAEWAEWPIAWESEEEEGVDEVGARLLGTLVSGEIGRCLPADAQAQIKRLVQSGAPMGEAADLWLEKHLNHFKHPKGTFVDKKEYMGFRILLKAACQAGRDAELVKHVEHVVVACVLDKIQKRAENCWYLQRQIDCTCQDLKKLRGAGLLGPLAAALQAAIKDRQADLFAGHDVCWDLLTEYAEADRWYARFLAISLKQRVPYGPAQLIAAFAVAEQPRLQGRRRVDGDPVAYTWEEFVGFYESVAEARKHWAHATPVIEQVSHEGPVSPIDPDAAHTLPNDGSSADSVIELVLHEEPPARVEPESAAELVAVMEAGAVERQLGGAVLEETGIQPEVDRLFFLQFNRCSKAMRVALGEGLPLQRCRQELEAEGCSFLQPCGNMIFVHPNQYHHARQAPLPITGVKHSCFYIVIAESLEYLVEESLSGIGKGAWARIREGMPLLDPSDVATIDSQDLLEEGDPYESSGGLVVKRTFLHYCPDVRNSASVVQSTTEAHGGGANPRRRLPLADL